MAATSGRGACECVSPAECPSQARPRHCPKLRAQGRLGSALSLTVTLTGRRGLSGTQFPQLPQSAGQAERGVAEPVASSLGGCQLWSSWWPCDFISFRELRQVPGTVFPGAGEGLCPPRAAEPGLARGGVWRSLAMAPWPPFSLTLPGLVTAPSLQALVPLGACALHPAQTLVPNSFGKGSACGPFPGKILRGP